MKGPTKKLMPFLCMKCNTRAPEFVVEHHTQDVIEICKCGRLVNRSTGRTVERVVYQQANGTLMQYIAGDDRVRKLGEPQLSQYLRTLVDA